MFRYDINTDSFSDDCLVNSSRERDPSLKDFEYSRYNFGESSNKVKIINDLKKTPIELCVEITDRCNFSCPICIASASVTNERFLSKEKFSEVLIQLKDKVQRVCITGGEPLLHPEIEEFVSISSNKYPTILSTNGYYSEKVEVLSRNYKNMIFAFSIHGDKDIHDKFVNFEGAYKNALHSMKIALANKALVHAYTVASHHNINSTPELIDFLNCYSLKLHKINVIKGKGRLGTDMKEIDLKGIILKCEKSKISKIQFKTFPYYLLNSNGNLEVVKGYE